MPTRPIDAPSTRGTLLAADLARIIDDAAIFACRSSVLPSINAIHFESTAKHLIAVATDRFTLGSAVAEYHRGGGSTFTATLKLTQAQILAKVAKSTRAAFTEVTATMGDATATFAFSSGEQLSLPHAHDETWSFPNWRKLVADRNEQADEPTPSLALDPQLLAKFGRVSGARRMVVKLAGERRPALVTIGTQFVGIVMPMHVSDKAELTAPLPDWLTKPKRKPRVRKAADKTVA